MDNRNVISTYGMQCIEQDDIDSVVKVLESSLLTQGPVVKEFEEGIAEHVGAKYAVAFCNATAALHASLKIAGIKDGDEVITTPLSFVATSNAIVYCGATPIFVDINKETFNIDVKKIEEKITSKTKAILSVDFAGLPVEYNEIKKIADKYNLLFISDAAHSFGATYLGQKVGLISDMTIFSFHPVKPLTTGEGGIVITNSSGYYELLLKFRSHGIVQSEDIKLPWKYDMQFLGFNYRMSDINAALGLSQLKKINYFLERRKKVADFYYCNLNNEVSLELPCKIKGMNSGWHIFVIRIKDELRDYVYRELRKNNIGVQIHYIPIYNHSYYQENFPQTENFPITDEYYKEALTLPIHPKMNESDVEKVCKILKAILKK